MLKLVQPSINQRCVSLNTYKLKNKILLLFYFEPLIKQSRGYNLGTLL